MSISSFRCSNQKKTDCISELDEIHEYFQMTWRMSSGVSGT